MTAANIPAGDHRDLLNIIDSLCSEGINNCVNPTEIIVCGDRSAGKSCVLEAISGKLFPVGDGCYTGFATELILRRAPWTRTQVRIIPGEGHSKIETNDIERWESLARVEEQDLNVLTQEAKDGDMRGPPHLTFHDILRVEFMGPNQPHLKLVDLPGLLEGDANDARLIRRVVKRYMKRPRSIILAVVSAKKDFALQEVLSMARKFDPEGKRTIGIITKPDTIAVGSDAEKACFRLVQNAGLELSHGWHILRNQDFGHLRWSVRDAQEAHFFKSGIWASANPLRCGVHALRGRLSSIIKPQILGQLPGMLSAVEDGIRECNIKLDRLGPARRSEAQQLKYLLSVSEQYTSLMTHAVNGTYNDGFFGHQNNVHVYSRRLRSKVQNLLLEFGRNMRLNGQSQLLYDSESDIEVDGEVSTSVPTPRSMYVEMVASRQKRSRGRELPGLFNPLIVGDLFEKQCEPWAKIAARLIEDVLMAVDETARGVIEHVVASDVSEEVLKHIRDGIEVLKNDLNARMDELLVSAMQCPTTCNPQLMENVQKTQQARHRRAISNLVLKTFDLENLTQEDITLTINPSDFMDLLGEVTEPDLERIGSSLAMDYMEAYYKAGTPSVAFERFIDDVSVLAVENCLIGKLPELFKPEHVAGFSPEDISRLAGETEETIFARNILERKCKTLEAGLRRLKRFNIDRALSLAASRDDEVTEDTSDEDSLCLEEVSGLFLSSEEAPAATSQDDLVAQSDQDDEITEDASDEDAVCLECDGACILNSRFVESG